MHILLILFFSSFILAQGTPAGNPVGAILGIFAMCGSNPVNCGNGWCCLSGQTCTNDGKDLDVMCNDPQLVDDNGHGGVVVNAAYFGQIQQHQVSPPGNGTTSSSETITEQSSTLSTGTTAKSVSFSLLAMSVISVAVITINM